jgi:diacylglycerol kinase
MDSSSDPRRWRQSLWRSFRVACGGLVVALRRDRNVRLHAVATAFVLLAGGLCRLNRIEWALVALAMGVVWAAELLNTAIEAAVDLAAPDHHELARLSKDVSSAAVLMAAVSAVAVGLLIFGPRLLELVQSARPFG